jgi:hypothetical protein
LHNNSRAVNFPRLAGFEHCLKNLYVCLLYFEFPDPLFGCTLREGLRLESQFGTFPGWKQVRSRKYEAAIPTAARLGV